MRFFRDEGGYRSSPVVSMVTGPVTIEIEKTGDREQDRSSKSPQREKTFTVYLYRYIRMWCDCQKYYPILEKNYIIYWYKFEIEHDKKSKNKYFTFRFDFTKKKHNPEKCSIKILFYQKIIFSIN